MGLVLLTAVYTLGMTMTTLCLRVANHPLFDLDTMHKMGFPQHIVELLERLYKNHEAGVKTNCGTSEWFSIGRGD